MAFLSSTQGGQGGSGHAGGVEPELREDGGRLAVGDVGGGYPQGEHRPDLAVAPAFRKAFGDEGSRATDPDAVLQRDHQVVARRVGQHDRVQWPDPTAVSWATAGVAPSSPFG